MFIIIQSNSYWQKILTILATINYRLEKHLNENPPLPNHG